MHISLDGPGSQRVIGHFEQIFRKVEYPLQNWRHEIAKWLHCLYHVNQNRQLIFFSLSNEMLFCQTNYLVIVLTEGTIYVVLNFLTTKCSVNWVTIVHCFACNCFLLFKSFWGHDDWARGSFTTYGNCTLFWPDRGRGVPEPWWAGKSSKPTCFTRFDSGLWFFFSIFHNVYLSLRTWGVWKWKGNFFFCIGTLQHQRLEKKGQK